jgi:fatty acid desaturase
MPLLISPRHWVGWHNRMHHHHTMAEGVDPDSFPTLETYQKSWKARAVDLVAFGGHRPHGLMTLLFGLLGQSVQVLLSSGPKARYLSPAQYRWALFETAAAVGVWLGVGILLGWKALLFGWAVPMIVANTILMAYIMTNHSLSPMTEVNDPLVNSLSVTTPRWYEVYSLGFGMHVEHHLFPAMSSAYAPRVRAILREKFADRYREMSLSSALRKLFGTGRVYKTPTTLLDPRTGRESSTI